MKKTLALLLAIAMIFTLAACGKKPAEDKTSDKAEKKTEQKAKVAEPIKVSGEDISTTPEGIEELSEEKLKEIYEYFDENYEETVGMTYAEVEKKIGVPGAYFVDFDEEDENGNPTKTIFWFSPDHFLYVVFVADKDNPDEFGLDIAGALPKNIDEYEEGLEEDTTESGEEETTSESDGEVIAELSPDTGMVEVTNGDPDKSPGDTWELSEEYLEEVAKYFDENYEETLGMTYEEVRDYIGMPGTNYPDYDELDPADGVLAKYVFWYSPDHAFVAMFTADAEYPDEFELENTAYYEQVK